MRARPYLMAAALIPAACSSTPTTDAALASEAQQAVDRAVGEQAVFSEMETTVARRISCGHLTTSKGGRDFVYREGRLILDDDPDFDAAAIECDTAAGAAAGGAG